MRLEDNSLERICLTILRDVAKAVSVAHSADIAHRELSPLSILIYIDENEELGKWVNGNWVDGGYLTAKVSGWDRADLVERPTNSIVFGTENQFSDEFAAPEIGTREFLTAQHRWLYADLWSLGKIIEWIWGKNGIAGGELDLPESLEKLANILTDTDLSMREEVDAYQVFMETSEELKDRTAHEPLESATQFSDDIPIAMSTEVAADFFTEPVQKGIAEYEPGDLIGGKWEVEERLGGGATSEVYHVVDATMELITQHYALKLFSEEIERDLVEVEFGALINIHNRHIVRVYSLESIGETFGLLTALVKGKDLRACIRDHSLPERPKIISLFREILFALCELHESRGSDDLPVIHRDIKPENLMYNERTGLILIDFGGASIQEAAARQGVVTYAYRHADFKDSSKNPELDLFAFAVTFHEALTGGNHPFEGLEICLGDPVIDDELDPSLKAFFLDSLNDDAARRYKSASDMLEGFDEAVKNLVDEDLGEVRDSNILDQQRSEGRLPLGPKVTLEILPGVDRRLEAFSPSGEPDVQVSVTSARIFSANEGVDDIRLDVEICQTDYGETWVKGVHAHGSPPRIQRLVHGLRPGIHPIPGESESSDKVYMELRQAQIIDDPDWPKVRKVSLQDLNDAAGGIDIVQILQEQGALSVMTREDTWGDSTNRKTDLCVCFREEDIVVPLAAYALTRVAPLVNERVELAPEVEVGDNTDRECETPELPPLDTRLSTGAGGMGSNWLDDHCYWAIHPISEENPTGWREINFPFKSLETALFGGNGAEALFKQKGRMAQRTNRWGEPQLVVIRVGQVAVLTDGLVMALVEWRQVDFENASQTMDLFKKCEKLELRKATWSE